MCSYFETFTLFFKHLMSFPNVLNGQFHGNDFELQLKYKYQGQKKSTVVKEFPKGGRPPVSFESKDDKQFVKFHCPLGKLYELNVSHLHGAIFSLTSNENCVVYLAEVKKPDVPWYTAQLGERFPNKRHPVLVVVDLKVVCKNYNSFYKLQGKQEELPGISVLDTFDLGYIPWYISLSPTDILVTGIYHQPILLGVVYCPNRPSDLFKIPFSLDKSKITKLTDGTSSVRSPLYCKSSDSIFYLSNPLMGPHFTNCKIMQIKNGVHSILVDTVQEAQLYKDPSLSFKSSPMSFAGIYLDQFHIQAIFNNFLILDTNLRSQQIIVIVNTLNGKIVTVTDPIKSFYFYGQNGTVAVINETSMQHGIVVKSVALNALCSGTINNVDVLYQQAGYGSINIKSLSPSMDVLILSPPTSNNKIIYYPHGGPHSAYTTAFSNNLQLFLERNYTVVLINYTGSIGYGENNVLELVGKIGVLDIQECYKVVELLQNNEFKGYKPYLTGGSHGGFIAGWLLGKYPTLFKACVMRNPVINLGLNVSSDILDWGFNEMGLGLDQSKPRFPTPEEYKILAKHSSDHLCKDVKTPTIVMIGKEDLRVPPFQGLRWVQMVNAYNKDCAKAIIYDENGHSLDLFEADVYGHEVLLNWFDTHE